MKKLLFTKILILVTSIACAQSLQKEVQHPDIAGRLFRNPKAAQEKIEGSPYTTKMFAQAEVVKIKVKAYMRYNAFADEFEFITPKNDTLILDRLEDFGTISFPGLNKKYQLSQYVDNKGRLQYGYLLEGHSKNNYGLFKKESVIFIDAKVAKSTMETSMPAKYNKQSDKYFLKNKEAGIVAFPDSKKALIKLFPDKKEAIETFLKTNPIDFDLEADLIKVVDFLGQ
ncbi:hypothetical protein [Flavobacterium sp.]|uniref:hypothetical protein n=1 Tax=Flavobacterium sp. TaxID=239 RepID=UPI0039E6A982